MIVGAFVMKVFYTICKTVAIVVALLLGLGFSSQAGWSGGEVILTDWQMGAAEATLIFIIFAVSALLFIGCTAVIYRIAKLTLWIATPVFLYSTLVLGVWNGYASAFD